jgi:predicted NBD/HSP70 family sugar kinase
MRFYKAQHQFYTKIDLHATTMYVCVMDHTGSIVYHKNLPSTPEALQQVISLYGTDNVIGVECILPGTGSPISAVNALSPSLSDMLYI